MNSEYTCTQCRESLPGYVAGTLDPAKRLSVAAHLATCEACQREHAQWRTLADLARQTDAQTPKENAQSARGTWAAIEASILSESPFTTGALFMDFDQQSTHTSLVTPPLAASPPSQRSPARRRFSVAAMTAALLLVAFAAAIFALHPRQESVAPGNGRKPLSTPTATAVPAVGLADVTYGDAAVLSPADAWAIGNGTQQGGAVYTGAISHFDGHQWIIGTNAVFPNTTLSGIAMDAADDGWAVGAQGINIGARKPLLLHYTQGHWIPQTLTNYADAVLEQVQMFGPDDGWATGKDIANGPIFLHYHQGVWTPTTFAPTTTAATTAYYTPQSILPPGVSPVSIQQAQFLSDTEGWAWGQDNTDNVLWRYHNGQWQTVFHIAASSAANFFGIGANSATDVWILGSYALGNTFAVSGAAFVSEAFHSSGGAPVLFHFDGHAWARIPIDISAGAPFLAGATWLASGGSVNQRQQVTGLLLNQSGHWRVTTFTQPVTHVLSAMNAPDGSTLVVAAIGSENGPQTLQLLRYANGAWSSLAAS